MVTADNRAKRCLAANRVAPPPCGMSTRPLRRLDDGIELLQTPGQIDKCDLKRALITDDRSSASFRRSRSLMGPYGAQNPRSSKIDRIWFVNEGRSATRRSSRAR